MENNRGYLGEVLKTVLLGSGSFADVYMADYNDRLCAYKEFWNPKYVEAIKDMVIKLSDHYGDSKYLFPFKIIYKHPKDELFKGYVMEPKSFYDSLDKLNNLDIGDKIHILRLGRDLVEGLHNNHYLIHGDLTPWNFMYNKTLDSLVLGDFDSSIDLKNKSVNMSEVVYDKIILEYIKNNGVDKDLDIFLYNLCCFVFINGGDYYQSLEKIAQGDYGFIISPGALEILSTYKDFDKPKSIKKEYIIDYI